MLQNKESVGIAIRLVDLVSYMLRLVGEDGGAIITFLNNVDWEWLQSESSSL